MPIAVVSGADRNIGLEIVKQFLQRGWKVFAGRYLMELQSRLFMHNIRFSFVLNRQAVRLPCSQSLG